MRSGVPAWVVLIAIAAASAVWQLVFAVTGVGQTAIPGTVPPPAPVAMPALDTSWVDIDLYAARRPFWAPRE
ncbi:MAG: hypothetical protein H5T86_01975 [Armatimonadetes bacterium]|nr:hypothetical protein [Armatimonadota bacterium]